MTKELHHSLSMVDICCLNFKKYLNVKQSSNYICTSSAFKTQSALKEINRKCGGTNVYYYIFGWLFSPVLYQSTDFRSCIMTNLNEVLLQTLAQNFTTTLCRQRIMMSCMLMPLFLPCDAAVIQCASFLLELARLFDRTTLIAFVTRAGMHTWVVQPGNIM